MQSGVDRTQAGVVESLPDIAIGERWPEAHLEGARRPHQPAETRFDKASNVVIRGVTPNGLVLRPQVRLVEGRMFRPGTSEIITGRSIAEGFQGAGVGETLRFASRDWTVVGVFDAGRTGFDSEIWGDAEQMLQAFRRLGFSALIFRLADSDRFDAVKEQIESDPRLTLEAKRETRFYADQSESLSKFISYLGTTISVIFSIGAIIGAMITMYASVASRTAEIGTLRALGFPRTSILVAFLVEALMLGLLGRRHRPRRRIVHAGAVDLDDELPDVRRDRLLVQADARRSSRRRWRSRWRWASSAGSCRPPAPRG